MSSPIKQDEKLKAQGNQKFSLKKYDQAITYYSQAIEINQLNASLFYNRGLAKFELKQYDEALQDFNTAITLKPIYSKAHIAKLETLLQQRKLKAALTAIEIARDYGINDQEFTAMAKQIQYEYSVENCDYEIIENNHLKNFIQWFSQHSDSYIDISLSTDLDNTDELTLKTTLPISAKEKLIAIPKDLIISSEYGKLTEIGKELNDLTIQNKDLIYLSLFLLEQKNLLNSQWKPFLDILFLNKNLYMYWSEKIKSLLEDEEGICIFFM